MSVWSWLADTIQVVQCVFGLEKGTGIPEGIWILVILVLVLLLIRRYRRDMKAFQSQISESKDKLDTIHESSLASTDKRIIRREELLDLLQTMSARDDAFAEHIKDTKKLASEEVWKHCPIDRCPNLSKIVNFLSEISTEIKTFTTSASQVRDQTQSTIINISSRIDRFIDGLGQEFLISLRSRRRDD
jgi:hypothetical protein